jgi:hypothetical protein
MSNVDPTGSAGNDAAKAAGLAAVMAASICRDSNPPFSTLG